MMNINPLEIVTPPYIYHGCSAQKMFWEENFTIGEFTSVNMKFSDCRNARKHRDIKGSDKYVTLDISLKFDSLYKIKIISSESKIIWEYQERGWLHIWVSRPNQGQQNKKGKVCHPKCQ